MASAALGIALSGELTIASDEIVQNPEMPDIVARALCFHQRLLVKKINLVVQGVGLNPINVSHACDSVLNDLLQILFPGVDTLIAVRSECTMCDEFLAQVIPRGVNYRAVTCYNACLYRRVAESALAAVGGIGAPQPIAPNVPAAVGVPVEEPTLVPMNAPIVHNDRPHINGADYHVPGGVHVPAAASAVFTLNGSSTDSSNDGN